ncbi:MAG: FkbM family methyltransferase [Solirubrobacteraceae bacterium]
MGAGAALAAQIPRRVQERLFDAFLRATMISAARGVSPSSRFVLNELFLMRGTRRYRLRRSGKTLFVRHPVADAWVVHEVVNNGAYVPPPAVERAIARLRRPRLVDLGAHIGASTLLLLERFPAAQVLAVEPHPQSAAMLRAMIAANDLEGQCEVRQAAVGVRAARASMEGFSVLAHLVRADTEEAVDILPPLRRYQAGGGGRVDVEVVDALPLLQDADLVKIDIEGAEWPILQDPRFRSLGISALVLEYHPQGAPEPDTTAAVRRLLGAAGFTVGEPFAQHGALGMIWAWRE